MTWQDLAKGCGIATVGVTSGESFLLLFGKAMLHSEIWVAKALSVMASSRGFVDN
jgi:hypothetical protein